MKIKRFFNMFSRLKYARKSTILVFGLTIGLIFGIGGTAAAAILIGADEVSYDGKDTNAVSVKEALDELYSYSYNQGGITGVEGLSWEYDTGQMNTFLVPLDGYYTFELWGASGGGTTTYPGGNGAYTKGDIYLTKGEKLYINVGGQGAQNSAGYNGGGAPYGGGYGGGGSTDVRTLNGSWNDINSLRSRIMVAAGGSGTSLYSTTTWWETGAPAGGLTSYLGNGGSDSINYRGTIATQVQPGLGSSVNYAAPAGGFGYGSNGYQNWTTCGGGSGWYGGAGCSHAGGLSSSGTSYISGHDGCIAVDAAGNHIGTSISHTKKYFTNTVMIDGKGYQWTTVKGKDVIGMPSYDGKKTMNGNSGNGKAKITFKRMVKEAGYEENGPTIQKTWSYYASGTSQPFEANKTGTYKVQLWGASGGGNDTYSGGNGSYTEGEIFLTKGTKLYVYTGISGNELQYKGFNGGGAPTGSSFYGGGATDIRTVGGAWNNSPSLISRIMVAAGGSGASIYTTSTWWATGGAGGGLTGYLGKGGSDAIAYTGTVPTQTVGGQGNSTYTGPAGSFGIGGAGYPSWSTGGGGSGWYGGVGSSHAGGLNSSGSSYISGHEGCIGVDVQGNPIGNSLSYTGLYFVKTKMIDGLGYQWTTIPSAKSVGMPSHDGLTVISGNAESGFATITRVSEETTDANASKIQSAQNEWVYYASNTSQPFEANKDGVYKVELWGASGGGTNQYLGGKGAYTSGEITLKKGDLLYVYTGISGQNTVVTRGFNGGGSSYGNAYYGGGATDIRTINGAWNSNGSLISRIMVAAGGSGSSIYTTSTWWQSGAAAGGLTSYLGNGGSDAIAYKGTIATQVKGGTGNATYPGQSGGFGYGGYGYQNWATSGGGSGWYGGAGGSHAGGLSSSGTSYISGHDGCVGVTQTGAVGSSSVSYTGKKFTNTKMIDGLGYQWTTKVGTNVVGHPSYDLRLNEIGHEGDGFARIKYLRAS